MDFNKQISREQANSHNNLNINNSDYYFDYNIIKPKRQAALEFGKAQGRYDKISA